MAEQPSIQALVRETETYLEGVWDALGTDDDKRKATLSTVHDELEQVLMRHRDAADAEREEAQETRSELVSEIKSMAECTEVDEDLPEQGSKGVLQHIESLRARSAELASLKTERAEQISALHEEAMGLYADLGRQAEDDVSSVGDKLTTSRVHLFENRIADLRKAKEARRTQVDELCEAITGIWGDIGREAATDEEKAITDGAEGVGFTEESVATATAALEHWTADKAAREERIREIGERITVLWEKLETPEDEQTRFLGSHNGIGDDVIGACTAYLDAKAAEFQARLDELVTTLRERIHQVWDEIEAGEEEREAFAAMTAEGDDVDEACWEAHQAQLAALEARAETMRPILRVYAKRQAILDDKDEYERIIADPTRLTSRRAGAARLREEKLERRIKKELPRATARLRAATEAWEADTGETFVVGGERLLDALDREAEAEAEKKHRRQSERAARRGGPPSRASVAEAKPAGRARRASSRASSRGSTRSTSSTAAAPAAAAAAPPAARRKPLARSTGAANAAGPKGKRAAAAAARPPLATGAPKRAGAVQEPVTPSAVKVASQSVASAAIMAEALHADE